MCKSANKKYFSREVSIFQESVILHFVLHEEFFDFWKGMDTTFLQNGFVAIALMILPRGKMGKMNILFLMAILPFVLSLNVVNEATKKELILEVKNELKAEIRPAWRGVCRQCK